MSVSDGDYNISVDVEAFAQELEALRAELDEVRGPECLTHLKKMERWGRACTALGYATAWLGPNPVSIAALSLGRTARWTMIAHHVTHKGYDKVPGAPERLTSRGFARGAWRRMLDWLDVIEPEAWNEEHNILHHYNLGEEEGDPDLVQRNLGWLRESDLPDAVKVAIVAFYMGSWKALYYAPSTTKHLHKARARRDARRSRSEPVEPGWIWNPLSEPGRDLVLKSWLFYGLTTFGAIPALFLPLGPLASGSVLVNSALAELVTNVHTFIIITTNHTGDDLPYFKGRTRRRGEFYVRQIAGSVNYRTGGDLNDFLHGWLNYQIEHHVWPDLTMRQYQLVQPKLKALCEKHDVPYLQESVWTRLRKTMRVMIGRDTQHAADILDTGAAPEPAA